MLVAMRMLADTTLVEDTVWEAEPRQTDTGEELLGPDLCNGRWWKRTEDAVGARALLATV